LLGKIIQRTIELKDDQLRTENYRSRVLIGYLPMLKMFLAELTTDTNNHQLLHPVRCMTLDSNSCLVVLRH